MSNEKTSDAVHDMQEMWSRLEDTKTMPGLVMRRFSRSLAVIEALAAAPDAPSAEVVPKTRFTADQREHQRVIQGVDKWLSAYNLPTYSALATPAPEVADRAALVEFADAIEHSMPSGAWVVPSFDAHRAVRVLRAAAAPEAPGTQDGEFKNFHQQLCKAVGYTHDPIDWRRDQASLIWFIARYFHASNALRPVAPEAPAQPVQGEPVAWVQHVKGYPSRLFFISDAGDPKEIGWDESVTWQYLYTSPPARKRVTEAELSEVMASVDFTYQPTTFARAILAHVGVELEGGE